ncbi:PadR family transcriptional regulator [Salinactinospora qingdaonensis]|uniref:Helix-turn-helix transcriptional regulator n=1 Tax=Salinactinospora qingdaonensis TaxID=702744 RepID=A0ABP7GIZ1_9ACTN
MGYELNPTAASLLGFLHDKPLTGWDLTQVAEDTIGTFWSLTRSQVYRELSRMAEAGLIEAGDPGPRDRRPYALTDAGRQAFAAWAAQPPGDEAIRFPLLLMITLGRHIDPAVLAHHLRRHRRQHADRLADYEASWQAAWSGDDPAPDPYSLATLDFGRTYERAVLDWFDRLPELLDIDLTDR